MRDDDYIIEIVIERKRIRQKLEFLESLFHIKYETTQTMLYCIVRYTLYGPLDEQTKATLMKWRDVDGIIKCFFICKVSAIR